MYVQGVSTRKVAHITEQLCGFEVTSAQVSRAAAQLDETLNAWRNRPLGEMPYLILDARYEKVRQGGIVQSAAVLIAVGVGLDGKRQIIGVSVAVIGTGSALAAVPQKPDRAWTVRCSVLSSAMLTRDFRRHDRLCSVLSRGKDASSIFSRTLGRMYQSRK